MSTTTRFIHDDTGLPQQQNLHGNWTPTMEKQGILHKIMDSALIPETHDSATSSECYNTNGLVYLRARYYNPTLGVFPSLDPIEGNTNSPMSLNRYSYVNNNPTNLTDPSGLDFTCTGDAQSACQDLNDALLRGQNLGLPQIQHSGTITSDDLADIVKKAQSAFGVSLYFINDPITLANCLVCVDPNVKSKLPLAQNNVLRGVAALIHTAAQIGVLTTPGAALMNFKNLMSRHPIYMKFNANDSNPTAQYPTLTGQTSPTSPEMLLGSNMSVASITHEIGHAFDRIGERYSLGNAMQNGGDLLMVSPTGLPGNPPIHVAPYSQLSQLGDAHGMLFQEGMTGRARNPDNVNCSGDVCPNTTASEIFPDMFMNWVLADAQPYHFHTGDINVGQPGWEHTMYGTAKAAYVAQAVLNLINSTGTPATPAATQAATATPYPMPIPSTSSFVDQLNQAIQTGSVGGYKLP